MKTFRWLFFLICWYGATGSFAQTNDLIWEIFQPFSGTFAELSQTTQTPTLTKVITSFYGPQTSPDLNNYKSRIRGYIFPQVTGYYTFYIASDDGSELWLSTDTSRTNKRRICLASVYRSSYTSNPEQKSDSIFLTGGRVYYVEVLHAEGSGGDWVKVGWTRPGESPSTINDISGQYISRLPGSEVTLAAGNVPAGRIPINSKNNVLYRFSVSSALMKATLSRVAFKTGGTYTLNDVKCFRLLYNDSIPSLSGARQRGSDTVVASGDSLVFLPNLAVPLNDTLYFMLVADIPASATENATVFIQSVSFDDIGFKWMPAKKGSNPLPAGGVKTIQNIHPEAISISKDSLSVVAGYSSLLTATVYPDSASFKNVYWISDNPSVATVDNNGKVTGKIDGQVRVIVMTYDSLLKDTCLVTVLPNNSPARDIAIVPSVVFLSPGESIRLSVITDPPYITRQTLVWTSDNDSVASVDTTGLVTGGAKGEAIIYATLQGALQAMCVVYVFPQQQETMPAEIELYPVPAHETLHLVFPQGSFREAAVVDMQGICRQTKELCHNHETLDVQSLPSGKYILVLTGNTTKALMFIKE